MKIFIPKVKIAILRMFKNTCYKVPEKEQKGVQSLFGQCPNKCVLFHLGAPLILNSLLFLLIGADLSLSLPPSSPPSS